MQRAVPSGPPASYFPPTPSFPVKGESLPFNEIRCNQKAAEKYKQTEAAATKRTVSKGRVGANDGPHRL